MRKGKWKRKGIGNSTTRVFEFHHSHHRAEALARAMSDAERRAYFAQAQANQPVDMSAFREALAQRRSSEHQAEREAGNAARSG